MFSSSAGDCYEAHVRPRFVVVLCLVAWLVAALELAGTVVDLPLRDGPVALVGRRFGGDLARLLPVVESLALCAGAWGLWNLRPWARVAAMAYLAAVILSFLFLGVGTGHDRPAWSLLWQVTIVPFATFCYMFLYNGRRHFGADARGPQLR